jgi:hypothetical protein
MELDPATMRIARAARELGGDPAAVVERVLPGELERKVARQVAEEQVVVDRVSRAGVELRPVDEEEVRTRVLRFLYGVCVGRVMAEDKAATKTLDDIYDEWLRGDYR